MSFLYFPSHSFSSIFIHPNTVLMFFIFSMVSMSPSLVPMNSSVSFCSSKHSVNVLYFLDGIHIPIIITNEFITIFLIMQELLELGETVGTHSRGLSQEQISLLPVSKFKCCFLLRRKFRSERLDFSSLVYLQSISYGRRCAVKFIEPVNLLCQKIVDHSYAFMLNFNSFLQIDVPFPYKN